MPPYRIALAPMEGLVDHVMRDILTRAGGMDGCVTEFIRVTNTLLPARTYWRVSPELLRGGKTPAGVPVKIQLLGSDPICLADNAARAAELGAPGIDLNFGCPAKSVNRHRGGAVLLDEPALLHDIVLAVRRAVPAHIPVSAKMRLGHLDTHLALDCARALAEGGAAEIVVHARTKLDGYKPPAYWPWIAKIRETVSVPIVANGEIWTPADYMQCVQESGCRDVMLGRGLVARPDLAMAIRTLTGHAHASTQAWETWLPYLGAYLEHVERKVDPRHVAGRIKQWLGYLRRTYQEADDLFYAVRKINTAAGLRPFFTGQDTHEKPQLSQSFIDD